MVWDVNLHNLWRGNLGTSETSFALCNFLVMEVALRTTVWVLKSCMGPISAIVLFYYFIHFFCPLRAELISLKYWVLLNLSKILVKYSSPLKYQFFQENHFFVFYFLTSQLQLYINQNPYQ